MLAQKNIKLFTDSGVMSERELQIKHAVLVDRYKTELNVEFDCLV